MLWLIIPGALAAALLWFVVANRWADPRPVSAATLHGAGQGAIGDTVTVTSWNIGYAGMGQDSEFVLDGGKRWRTPAAAQVDANLAAISSHLAATAPDIALIQEVARPGWLTYGRDVIAAVLGALPGHAWMFSAEARLRGLPRNLGVAVGNAILTRFSGGIGERRALPLEPTRKLGIFRKRYRMHILRQGDWTFINIHLSTFDTAAEDVRRKQVMAVLDYAQGEYAKGRHVVIGGDWNLRLVPTDFPHETPAEFQFWIRDFPGALVPDGWHWAVDPAVPTVRTAHQSYVAGQNMVMVIDGFLVSPNVRIDAVHTDDLGFVHSDHHPVTATLAAL